MALLPPLPMVLVNHGYAPTTVNLGNLSTASHPMTLLYKALVGFR